MKELQALGENIGNLRQIFDHSLFLFKRKRPMLDMLGKMRTIYWLSSNNFHPTKKNQWKSNEFNKL
jgi:hypothetical protein